MGLYNSNTPIKEVGGSWKTGLYKFQVKSAELHERGSIKMNLQTWTEDGQEGPKIIEWLNINSSNERALDEVNRRLQVMLGKTVIESSDELNGKAGYVVLYKPKQYFEAYPFGGFYTAKKLSATGSDTTAERIEEATKAQFKAQENVETPAPTPETTQDLPF